VPVSPSRVEQVLKASGAALVWVTHDSEQHRRVGGRQLLLPAGTITTISSSASASSLGTASEVDGVDAEGSEGKGSGQFSSGSSTKADEIRVAIQL
jgi:ABC-type sulfate/molybdate transport systems ATPase subunit